MSEFADIFTKSVHGDARAPTDMDVAPAMHPTTIKHYSKPEELVKAADGPGGDADIYSRESNYNCRRVEANLSQLLDGHALAYSSGLSAFQAILFNFAPKRLFIGDGYHGVHGVATIFERFGLQVYPLEKASELAQDGDLVHLETPVNPTGLAFDIAHFASLAHAHGAKLSVDATFAPPPLFHPFQFGADIIMHSATKYFGGHSDILAGVLVTQDEETAKQLKADRVFSGTILQAFEAWMLLRSLKTFPLRIRQQSQNANAIVRYLADNQAQLPKLKKVISATLQTDPFVAEQLPLGGSPTFAIEVEDEETARYLPSKLQQFYHATSLGSVHSVIEWRALSDETVDPRLLRLTIGIESADDLISDLRQALQ